jgi:hypothetical protein
MKTKIISKCLLIFTAILIATLFCNAQNNASAPILDSIKLKVKILNSLAVGWGIEYRATVEEIPEGCKNEFNDTIIFGAVDVCNIGDSYLISLVNSKKIHEGNYEPPNFGGTVSKQKEIWLVTNIESLTNVSKRSTFVGTATMKDGKAMFIWDFSLSESFYLDGLTTWDEKYLNKKINVEGVLIQFIDGKSVIIDWKMVEPK